MAITIDGSSGIASVDGSAGSPSIRGSDANSGILYAADAIKFSTGGTQRAIIDNNGLSAAGHFIQVVETITTSHITKTSAQQITELNRTITPRSSSNKILLICDLGCVSADSAADIGVVFTLGGNNINDSLGASASAVNASNVPGMNFGGTYAQCAFFYYIHSPSSTSELTYGIKAYPNGSRTMYLNRRGNDTTYASRSKLMCIELGG